MSDAGRKALELMLCVVAAAIAIPLIGDALTYSMYAANPSIGRAKGCYVKLDLLLGVNGMRPVQLALGAALLLVASYRFARTLRRA